MSSTTEQQQSVHVIQHPLALETNGQQQQQQPSVVVNNSDSNFAKKDLVVRFTEERNALKSSLTTAVNHHKTSTESSENLIEGQKGKWKNVSFLCYTEKNLSSQQVCLFVCFLWLHMNEACSPV